MKSPIIILFLLFSLGTQARVDSVVYTRDFQFKEGLYLNFFQFRNNDPIPLSSIISNYDQNDREFMLKVLSHNKVVYKDTNGAEQKINSKDIWGYTLKRDVFIQTSGSFMKIQIIGSICHFLRLVLNVPYNWQDDPYSGFSGHHGYHEQQSVLDMETGNIYDFTVTAMEKLLQRDQKLFLEFMSLKKKKKRNSIFIYLKKYNEAHPLYIKNLKE
jgi:hypothetical protein